ENTEIHDTDWLIVLDADEFVSIKVGRGWIRDLIAHVPSQTDAIALTWRFFGSSGHQDWNPGLVTSSYTNAAPDNFKRGWGVKTLFRPFEDMKLGIHRPHMRHAKSIPSRAQAMLAQNWVNGSGQPMPEDFALAGWRSTKPTLGYDHAEINHYGVKSLEAYLLRQARGNVNNKADKYNDAYFALFDRNEIPAPNIQRHGRATRRMLARLLEDPVLDDLQQQAIAWHRARMDEIRSSDTYAEQVEALQRAGAIPFADLDQVLFTQHLPKIWQSRIASMRKAGVADKDLALMIARSQTARKGEIRTALRATAASQAPEQAKGPRDPVEAAAPGGSSAETGPTDQDANP
ncbi:MAG: glycosyltransferase family 2 protein, partial [Pseudomonadota bacterium]